MIGVAAAAEPAERQLVLILENYQIVNQSMLAKAKPMVARMFAEVGVRVVWCLSGSCRNTAGSQCGRVTIPIIFKAESVYEKRPKALAYAFPYSNSGPGIYVLNDRMRERVRLAPALGGPLLAHVLVHEVTHILQGIVRHSEFGVMQAYWTSYDCDRMIRKPLPFSELDSDLLRKGFEWKISRGCETTAMAR